MVVLGCGVFVLVFDSTTVVCARVEELVVGRVLLMRDCLAD